MILAPSLTSTKNVRKKELPATAFWSLSAKINAERPSGDENCAGSNNCH